MRVYVEKNGKRGRRECLDADVAGINSYQMQVGML